MADLIDPEAVAYAARYTTPFEGAVAAAAAWTAANSDSPQMMAGLAEARLLEALVVATGASRVLEIGTFTAVGALSIAAALPEGGRLTTLELDEANAEVARHHLASDPHGDRVELIVGDARETLQRLDGPFDVVWIDAWKADYPAYYEAVLPKLAPRGMLVADNLFRAGSALHPRGEDAGTAGIIEFARQVQADQRVHNVLLTIGDGVMLAWPVDAGARLSAPVRRPPPTA